AKAADTDFAGYSDAMRGAKLVWDKPTLDKYLAGPATLVPGTRMVFAGIAKPEDRGAVIGWLEANTK
ncbi:c-type cytochrome, partial [Polymorphobacter multimanifer]